jgi:integrase/recombinase XerD
MATVTEQGLKFLNEQEQENLLLSCKNKKYKLAFLLMLDCGLRRGEVVNIQLGHIDFTKAILHVKSLKKRNDDVWRQIPIPPRTLEELANYISNLSTRNPEAHIFPSGSRSQSGRGGMNPRQIEKQMRKHTKGRFSPHALRHTYATRLVGKGVELLRVKKLLGHTSIKTTEIYAHIPTIQLREAVSRLDGRSWWQKMWAKQFPAPRVHILPTKHGDKGKFIIGRKSELAKLVEYGRKKVNTIILGPQGIGKSHLLDNYSSDKTLRVDDMTRGKNVLSGLVLELFDKDKEAVVAAVYNNISKEGTPLVNRDNIGQVVMKDSEKRLMEVLRAVTEPLEYTIVIDRADYLTPTSIRILEGLKNHFHIVAAARAIPLAKGTWLTNFQRLELKPLSRPESMELIERISRDFASRIKDFEAYKNHVYDQTVGNPLYIIEICERFEKEENVDYQVLREVNHTAARPDIDMTLPFVLVLSSLMILRYVGRELGDEDTGAYKLIGGAALLFLLFGRPIFKITKRKYV